MKKNKKQPNGKRLRAGRDPSLLKKILMYIEIRRESLVNELG